MDFTDFVEPCSLDFIHFHTFSIFVLAKIFITHGKDGFYTCIFEYYRNFF